MSQILKKKLTGIEKIEGNIEPIKKINKELLDELLVDSYVEAKGDEDLFYEFLSFKIKNNSDKEVKNLELEQKRENIWYIQIDFNDETREEYKVDMNDIKIPEKYLKD